MLDQSVNYIFFIEVLIEKIYINIHLVIVIKSLTLRKNIPSRVAININKRNFIIVIFVYSIFLKYIELNIVK